MPDAFEAAAREARDLSALNGLFKAAMRTHGFTAYAAAILHPAAPPAPMLLIDWPQRWLEMYAAQGFAGEDIVVEQSLRSPEPFTWSEIRARHPAASQRIFLAAADFGWHDGFAVPVHGPGADRGLVSLAAPSLFVDKAACAAVERIALMAFQHARRLAARSTGPAAEALHLTPRERDALELVARGKDDAAIAWQLGISRTTAHAHVERAKRRLGAATRAHAVALALVHRLI